MWKKCYIAPGANLPKTLCLTRILAVPIRTEPKQGLICVEAVTQNALGTIAKRKLGKLLGIVPYYQLRRIILKNLELGNWFVTRLEVVQLYGRIGVTTAVNLRNQMLTTTIIPSHLQYYGSAANVMLTFTGKMR
jgi:hypothetical protein